MNPYMEAMVILRYTHAQEMRQLHQSYEQKLKDQATKYKAKILSLRTNAGLERERSIQRAVFEEGIMARLCDLVVANYDPVKYPPCMHTLLHALTGQLEEEDELEARGVVGLTATNGSSQNDIEVKQEEIKQEESPSQQTKAEDVTHETTPLISPPSTIRAHAHQISYHRVAAFSETITSALHALGAAAVDPAQQEDEIESLHDENTALQHELATSESKVAQLKNELRQSRRENQNEHARMVRFAVRVAELQIPQASSREEFLQYLEDSGHKEGAIRVLSQSRVFATLWANRMGRMSRHVGLGLKRKRESDNEASGDGEDENGERRVRVKIEQDAL